MRRKVPAAAYAPADDRRMVEVLHDEFAQLPRGVFLSAPAAGHIRPHAQSFPVRQLADERRVLMICKAQGVCAQLFYEFKILSLFRVRDRPAFAAPVLTHGNAAQRQPLAVEPKAFFVRAHSAYAEFYRAFVPFAYAVRNAKTRFIHERRPFPLPQMRLAQLEDHVRPRRAGHALLRHALAQKIYLRADFEVRTRISHIGGHIYLRAAFFVGSGKDPHPLAAEVVQIEARLRRGDERRAAIKPAERGKVRASGSLFIRAVYPHFQLVLPGFEQFGHVKAEEGKAALVPAGKRLVHINFRRGKRRAEFQIVCRANALIERESARINTRAAPISGAKSVFFTPGVRQIHRGNVRFERRAHVAFQTELPASVQTLFFHHASAFPVLTCGKALPPRSTLLLYNNRSYFSRRVCRIVAKRAGVVLG